MNNFQSTQESKSSAQTTWENVVKAVSREEISKSSFRNKTIAKWARNLGPSFESRMCLEVGVLRSVSLQAI